MRVDHSAGKGTSGMDKNINKACLLLHCRYSNRPLLDVLLVECAASLCVCVCACVCVCVEHLQRPFLLLHCRYSIRLLLYVLLVECAASLDPPRKMCWQRLLQFAP